jgi:hypothetical protein
MPSTMLTTLARSPFTTQPPSRSRCESASGPITAMRFASRDSGSSLPSFFNSTMDFCATSSAAARCEASPSTAFSRAASE